MLKTGTTNAETGVLTLHPKPDPSIVWHEDHEESPYYETSTPIL